VLQRFATRSRSSCSAALGLLLAAVVGCSSPGGGAAIASPPPPPAEELDFSEFFVLPVGPGGLEPTPKLMALRGQRVRIEGFMVEEEEPYPGLFLLAPFPVALADRADGPADFLPPATLYVHVPEAQRGETLPHRRERLALTGTLELGAREEANGRFSTVRLRVDELPRSAIPSNPNNMNEGAIE
jgi:hypothetical protein